MMQKYFCAVPGCSIVVNNRCTYRAHVKRVHKNLSLDELKEWMKKISETKPIYEVSEDQIGNLEDDEKQPRKRRRTQR